MPGPRKPFEYAIVRVVPRVERGESLNAGIVLMSRPHRFLGARVDLDAAVLAALAPDCDPDNVRAHLDAIDRIADGRRDGRPDRRAVAAGAVPLAGRPVVDDHPAVRGPHGPHRRRRPRPSSTCSGRSSSAEPGRQCGHVRLAGLNPPREPPAPPPGTRTRVSGIPPLGCPIRDSARQSRAFGACGAPKVEHALMCHAERHRLQDRRGATSSARQAVTPLLRSRIWSSSCAASSTSLWRHSAARK